MPPINLFLSPQVSVPDTVVKAAAGRLERYFDAICRRARPQVFSHAVVRLNPHTADVGDRDLLVYLTHSSLIVALFERVYEPEQTYSPPGRAGGGTTKMPNGAVLSEVFWNSGLTSVGSPAAQGIALANLIFHEWAYNKHISDPVAIKGGGANFVRTQCGGGILSADVSYPLAAELNIISGNITSLARVLASTNKQDTCALFNDDLGF